MKLNHGHVQALTSVKKHMWKVMKVELHSHWSHGIKRVIVDTDKCPPITHNDCEWKLNPTIPRILSSSWWLWLSHQNIAAWNCSIMWVNFGSVIIMFSVMLMVPSKECTISAASCLLMSPQNNKRKYKSCEKH